MTKTKETRIDELVPDSNNANQGTQRGLGMLENSLRQHGAGRSILIDKNGKIVAGNKTVEAAASIGLEDIIIVQTDGKKLVAVQRTDLDLDTDKEARELAYLDNRVSEVSLSWNLEIVQADRAAGLNLDLLWTKEEQKEILGGDEPKGEDKGARVDLAEEFQKKWQVGPGQLWRLGEHRLICGDCTDRAVVERLMGEDRAEMVWTDPPYGVAIGDKNKLLNSIAPGNRFEENLENDTLGEPELRAMLEAAFDNAIAFCLAGAAWHVAAPPGPLHVIFGQVLKDRGIWRQTIQWVKNNATLAPLGVCYHWRSEPIFFGWLPNGTHRYYGGRNQNTVWEIDRPNQSQEHPTMKPVELVERAIENHSLRGEIVLDMFLGSGTTLIACERLGRKCRACEISPAYCAVAIQRWVDLTGGIPELMGNRKK